MIPPEQSPHVAPQARLAGGAAAILAELNPAQREAVTHGAGPLLVLAGAGSGKTRVITHRIAHLILDAGVAPSRIVAVTFTNKAAGEMRERVEGLLGARGLDCWIGTFHALCLRLLRREGSLIGLSPSFVIYDTDDQLALVKRILKDEDAEDAGGARKQLSRISRAKNALQTPSAFEKHALNPEAKFTARVYAAYETALREAQAVDFDDLLVRTLQLFDLHPEVAQSYAGRCEHLLVDEYQDTNRPQYLLIRHLASRHGNVFVVGDEDQSIYRFRGAEIRNILEFERDHAGTRTIRLEQNYRSSGTIIQAAGAVIAHNLYRKGKTLWTENEPGEKLELFRAPDDRAEAAWVSRRVKELAARTDYEDLAVLYRTNAQSRQLEEIFRRDRIPYQIVGSIQFYERKEIKDLLGYLKLTANPADPVAFRRVVNTPPRGIGATTLQIVEREAQAGGVAPLEAARRVVEQGALASRPAKMMRAFLELIDELQQRAGTAGAVGLLEHVIGAVDYQAYLEKAFPGQGAERMENVRALVSAAVEYTEESESETLQGFLDRSALVAGADEVGQRPGVTLMTVHCAKGLEYPVVFLVGLEENLFPHAMAASTDEDLEEERRLCYVAMTRAKRRLLLTHAFHRRFQGALLPNKPSRFLREIPAELIEESAASQAGFFDDWSAGEPRGGSSAARAVRRRPAAQVAVPPRPAGPQADPGDGYPVGAVVQHPSFGGGQILSREGSGQHLKLTIHFNEHGPKKILPAYTKLRVQVD